MTTVRARPGADRGSASIWVLAAAALLVVVSGAITLRTGATLARHQAQSAADAAALAAAGQIGVGDDPCAAAETITSANQAHLVSCVLNLADNARSGTVAVSVRTDVDLPVLGHDTVSARARAEREPPDVPPQSSSDGARGGLDSPATASERAAAPVRHRLLR